MQQPTFLSTQQAARFLSEQGIPAGRSTLENLRCSGGGPAFRKFGGRVRYHVEDLQAWIDQHGPKSSTAA